MSWQAPPRPEWVLAVNRGEVVPIAEVAARPLTPDDLLDEARATLGLDRRAGVGAIDGDDRFLEPLAVACTALEEEARLTVIGRWMTRRFLLRLLEGRFQLARYLAEDPGVRDEEIRSPILVTGAPRTGTTILYGLLSSDPALRVPEGWELLRPVPPPEPDRFPDPGRLVLAEQELRMMATTVSGLDAIHEYSGRMAKECLSAMSFEFLTEELTARYHVPSYVSYLQAADLTPAYEMHRLVLQVLQRRFGAVQWVLKSPAHLGALPTILSVYPDARIIVTHRDPLTVLPSVSSLVATLRLAFSDDVDMTDIGRYHAELYGGYLDALVDAERAGRARSGPHPPRPLRRLRGRSDGLGPGHLRRRRPRADPGRRAGDGGPPGRPTQGPQGRAPLLLRRPRPRPGRRAGPLRPLPHAVRRARGTGGSMTVDDDVTGKVVIVTGASRGIGRGLALHLARRGRAWW